MGLPGKYLSTNLVQERKENFIDSQVASLCPWSLYIYHWTAVVTIMCSISLQSMCTMPGCCLRFCRPYDVANPWCSMAGTLPSFCVHHISVHIQAKFQNTKLDKIFVSVCILVVLSFEVGQTSRSSIWRSVMPKKKFAPPSDLRTPVLVCNTHFNLLLKTLLNYKTSPWIQSLHTQKFLIKKIQQNSSKECITYSWLIHKLKLQNQPLDSNLHAQKSLKK
jgi:hypothetical protein